MVDLDLIETWSVLCFESDSVEDPFLEAWPSTGEGNPWGRWLKYFKCQYFIQFGEPS